VREGFADSLRNRLFIAGNNCGRFGARLFDHSTTREPSVDEGGPFLRVGA